MIPKAFNPIGPSKAISLTTSAAAGVGINSGPSKTANQFRIANAGSVGAFYSFSPVDASAAQTAAVIPTGTESYAYYIPAGSVEYITAPQGTTLYFSGITSSGTTTLYVCAGSGL